MWGYDQCPSSREYDYCQSSRQQHCRVPSPCPPRSCRNECPPISSICNEETLRWLCPARERSCSAPPRKRLVYEAGTIGVDITKPNKRPKSFQPSVERAPISHGKGKVKRKKKAHKSKGTAMGQATRKMGPCNKPGCPFAEEKKGVTSVFEALACCNNAACKKSCCKATCPGFVKGEASTSQKICNNPNCGSYPQSQRISQTLSQRLCSGKTTTGQSNKANDGEYINFMLRVTEDILRNNRYTVNEMEEVFRSHVDANRGRLDEATMREHIEHLKKHMNYPGVIDCECSQRRAGCPALTVDPDTSQWGKCSCGDSNCISRPGGASVWAGRVSIDAGTKTAEGGAVSGGTTIYTRVSYEEYLNPDQGGEVTGSLQDKEQTEGIEGAVETPAEGIEESSMNQEGQPVVESEELKKTVKALEGMIVVEKEEPPEGAKVTRQSLTEGGKAAGVESDANKCINPTGCGNAPGIGAGSPSKGSFAINGMSSKVIVESGNEKAKANKRIGNKQDEKMSEVVFYNPEVGATCHCNVAMRKTALKIKPDAANENDEYVLVEGPVCMPKKMLEDNTVPVLIENMSSILLDSDSEFFEHDSGGPKSPSASKVNLFQGSQPSVVSVERSRVAGSISEHIGFAGSGHADYDMTPEKDAPQGTGQGDETPPEGEQRRSIVVIQSQPAYFEEVARSVSDTSRSRLSDEVSHREDQPTTSYATTLEITEEHVEAIKYVTKSDPAFDTKLSQESFIPDHERTVESDRNVSYNSKNVRMSSSVAGSDEELGPKKIRSIGHSSERQISINDLDKLFPESDSELMYVEKAMSKDKHFEKRQASIKSEEGQARSASITGTRPVEEARSLGEPAVVKTVATKLETLRYLKRPPEEEATPSLLSNHRPSTEGVQELEVVKKVATPVEAPRSSEPKVKATPSLSLTDTANTEEIEEPAAVKNFATTVESRRCPKRRSRPSSSPNDTPNTEEVQEPNTEEIEEPPAVKNVATMVETRRCPKRRSRPSSSSNDTPNTEEVQELEVVKKVATTVETLPNTEVGEPAPAGNIAIKAKNCKCPKPGQAAPSPPGPSNNEVQEPAADGNIAAKVKTCKCPQPGKETIPNSEVEEPAAIKSLATTVEAPRCSEPPSSLNDTEVQEPAAVENVATTVESPAGPKSEVTPSNDPPNGEEVHEPPIVKAFATKAETPRYPKFTTLEPARLSKSGKGSMSGKNSLNDHVTPKTPPNSLESNVVSNPRVDRDPQENEPIDQAGQVPATNTAKTPRTRASKDVSSRSLELGCAPKTHDPKKSADLEYKDAYERFVALKAELKNVSITRSDMTNMRSSPLGSGLEVAAPVESEPAVAAPAGCQPEVAAPEGCQPEVASSERALSVRGSSAPKLLFNSGDKYHFLLRDAATSITSTDIRTSEAMYVQKAKEAALPAPVVMELPFEGDSNEDVILMAPPQVLLGEPLKAAEPIYEDPSQRNAVRRSVQLRAQPLYDPVAPQPPLDAYEKRTSILVKPNEDDYQVPSSVLEIKPAKMSVTDTQTSDDKPYVPRVFDYSRRSQSKKPPVVTGGGRPSEKYFEYAYQRKPDDPMSESFDRLSDMGSTKYSITEAPFESFRNKTPPPVVKKASDVDPPAEVKEPDQVSYGSSLLSKGVPASLTQERYDHMEIIKKLDVIPEPDKTPNQIKTIQNITHKLQDFRTIDPNDTSRKFQYSNPENFEIRRQSVEDVAAIVDGTDNAGNKKPVCCGLLQPPKAKKMVPKRT